MNIVDFFREYWSYISFGLVVLFEIILLVVKRFKVDVKLPSNSYSSVIELIKQAEQIYGAGHGKEKLNYVVELYLKKNEIKYFDNEVRYFISNLVESILSTPEKKGVSNEEVE